MRILQRNLTRNTDTHYRHALQTRTTDTHYRHALQTRTTDKHYRHALQTHPTDTFLFISHTTNVLLFKFRCNIFICVRIVKEMPGSVASGTLCIIYSVKHNFCKYNQLHVSATIYVHPHAECEEKNENKIFAAVYEIGVLV